MDKVVAFLEKYAQWLALGVATLFLGWMVYVNVVDRSDFMVEVANAPLAPGEVDKTIAAGPVARLQGMLGDSKPIPMLKPSRAAEEVTASMGANRAGMEALNERLAAIVGGRLESVPTTPVVSQNKSAVSAPAIPAVAVVGSMTGNSEVSVPPTDAPKVAAGNGPVVAPAAGTNWLTANKQWVTLEFTLRVKDLADAWTKAFTDPKTGKIELEPDVMVTMTTGLLWVEVQREEQLESGKWGPPTIVRPLPLIELPQWPPLADQEAEENYWAKIVKFQELLAHPPMYPWKHGDEWKLPSQVEKVEKAVAPDAGAAKPKTTAEIQKEYLEQQKVKQEKAKADAAQRKQKTAAAESAKKKTGGGGGTAGPLRPLGSYAPLPSKNRGDSPAERGMVPPGGPNGAVPPLKPLGTFGHDPVARPAYPPAGGGLQARAAGGGALGGKFNPLDLVNEKGEGQDITLWAHDETAQPGKTYRYSMRVYMRNPLYYVSGVPTTADTKKFALVSPWSAAQVVSVPPTTEFFFANFRAPIGIGEKKQVAAVTVDVFKRERGDWTQATWLVAPGDAIGGMKNGIDYSTGKTLVDLRSDPRNDKELRILVADESGDVEPRSFLGQVGDAWYKELKVKAGTPAAAAAAGGTGALVNQVGAP